MYRDSIPPTRSDGPITFVDIAMTVFRCPSCFLERYLIPNYDKLNAIAIDLAKLRYPMCNEDTWLVSYLL